MSPLVIALLAFALFACLGGTASAATEYCPVTLVPDNATAAASAHYAFRLEALSPRTVDAALVADTDGRWFSWKLNRVALENAFLQAPSAGSSGGYLLAVSPVLAVDFPTAVTVRYAWVTSAKTSGDTIFGWDAAGRVRCDVPDFESGDAAEIVIESLAPDPEPPPNAPLHGKSAGPPFAAVACHRPFAGVRLMRAAPADVPRGAISGFASHPVSARIEVAVDDGGTTTDTWLLSGTGFPALDRSAERAAAASVYAPAVSYCRGVRGFIVLRADFNDNGARLSPL